MNFLLKGSLRWIISSLILIWLVVFYMNRLSPNCDQRHESQVKATVEVCVKNILAAEEFKFNKSSKKDEVTVRRECLEKTQKNICENSSLYTRIIEKLNEK